MPLYYFDVFDGERLWTDEFGVELENLYNAREQAEALLPALAREGKPDAGGLDLSVIVRCHEGRRRYETSLSLRSKWVEPPDYPDPDLS